MKKLLFLLLLTVSACNSATDNTNNVIICTGQYSHAYHRTDGDCKGMRACKGDLKTITKDEAIKEGYHACKFCY